ncbi:hypothetical protein OIU80_07255 [Flavobacterium sp. LS1R47]|jgi:ABC-type multidrug transport system fused ATPase/permease subunit|uniref:Uncharacterized protein n=1 Tax=Flavobacterium frigoritolerans TaxID=2987686 RepID=A0A9X2ZNY9_9FLAO|nr:hypothetical protein [Flavobacterium frigoritolerans]MCV9932076.1 hypothetical protein [Flavobacterium frigoritolerans]
MDRKTKFFKTVLLLQFVLVLLLGALSLMNFRKQKLLNIRGLHPYEFNYGYAVPLILFVVCLVILIPYLFLKQQDVVEDEAGMQKKIRQQNFWKFAFYCNVFFVVIITIFTIAISRKDPFIIDQAIAFYGLVFLRSLLVIILSLVTASFLLSAGIYWKTNKTMGVVILLFGFLIICISLVYEAAFASMFMRNSEVYINRRDEKGLSSDAAQVSEDYVEESEEIDTEVVKSKLISSWNSLIQDWGGLEGKYDFYDVRILIGRSLDDHITENDYYYVVQYIDNLRERPDELYSGFENYRSVIYSIISPETYRIANFDKIVDGLLLTYEDIGAENQKLDEIYKSMNVSYDTPRPNMEQYYSEFEKHFSSETIRKLQDYKFSNGAKFQDSDLIWFYSFWARRNHEGNIEEIAIILNEIKEYYNQNQSKE